MTRAKIGDWGIFKRQNLTDLSFGTHLNVKLRACKPVGTREQMPKSFPLLKAFFQNKKTLKKSLGNPQQYFFEWDHHNCRMPKRRTRLPWAFYNKCHQSVYIKTSLSLSRKHKKGWSSNSPHQPSVYSSRAVDTMSWWHWKASSVPALNLIWEVLLITDKK